MKFPLFSKTVQLLIFAVVLVLSTFSCRQKTTAPAAPPPAAKLPEIAPEILKKIGFDISKIDENGLRGPADGKTSVAYEFCILSQQPYWEAVQKLDPTLKFSTGQCRIGCARNYWCILGTTSGKDWRNRLVEIAKLDFVKEIQETVWE